MANAYVTYDRHSGQIIGVHHGVAHEDDAKKSAQRLLKKLKQEDLAVLAIETGSMESGKPYKVDVQRKVLVSSSQNEAGVRFGFGKTGSASAASPKKS
jgi:hypothetical protein